MYTEYEYDAPWARRLALILDSRTMRAVMVFFVIVSVVPELPVGKVRWLFFTAFFMAVAMARFALYRRHPQHSRLEIFLLGADFFVALTFLPWELYFSWITPQRLHALWVLRLLVLLRPGQSVLEDLWGILTRRERLQQFTSVTAAVAILALLSTAILLNLAPPYDYNGVAGTQDDTFLDILWWAFRQLESADNLVPTLRNNPLLVGISLGLTLVGVFIIAFIIGIGSSVVEQLIRAERRRPVDYEHHSVIIGPVHEAEILVRQYVEMHEKNRSLRRIGPRQVWLWLRGHGPRPKRHALPRIALLGDGEQPPAFLFEPTMRKVLYRSGPSSRPDSLALVGAHRAKRILLLAATAQGHRVDATTLATLGALRSLGSGSSAYLEIFDRENTALAHSIGGPRTVIIDVPRIVGQFLSAHLVVPGVDQIFHDLLTTQGCEIYTHVLLASWEKKALATCAETHPTVPFTELWRRALAMGVTLVGVLIREPDPPPQQGAGGVSFEGLTPWINPLAHPYHDSLKGAGLEPGLIPLDRLGGFVGLSETYKEIKDFSEHLLRTGMASLSPLTPPAVATAAASRLSHDDCDLRRVLIIGESDALTALVLELTALVPGVELTVLLSTDNGDAPLAERLDTLPLRFDDAQGDPNVGGIVVPLGGAGCELRVMTATPRRILASARAAWLKEGPFEAVVFLGDNQGPDSDAVTGHRALRFAQTLIADSPDAAPHLLIESHSMTQGQQIARDLSIVARSTPALRFTPVSADRIRNYFMVHSAFVPGVERIYGEILSEEGQDLMLLAWPGGDGALTWMELAAALWAQAMLPLAFQLNGEGPTLSPPGDTLVPLDRLKGVYVLGDTERTPRPQQPVAPPPADNR